MGKAIAKAYLDHYNEKPKTRTQWVDGAKRDVNHYTQKHYDALDIPMLIRRFAL